MATITIKPDEELDLSSSLCNGLKFYTVLDSLSPRNLVDGPAQDGVSNNDPVLSYGPYGPCLLFDRTTNNWIDFGGLGSIGDAGDFTAIVLVNLAAIPTNTSCFFLGTFNPGATGGWGFNYSNFPGTAVGFRLVLANGSLQGLLNVVGGTGILDRWAILAASFSRSKQESRLYIDGMLEAVVNIGTLTNSASATPLTIGAVTGGGNGTNGYVGWVAAFDRVLSDEEVFNWVTTNDMFEDPIVATPDTVISKSFTESLTLTEPDIKFVFGRNRGADTLTFTESNTRVVWKSKALTDALTFSEKHQQVFFHPDTLTFTESTVTLVTPIEAAADTVVFTETFDALHIPSVTFEDELTFTEVFDVQRDRGRVVEDVFGFDEFFVEHKSVPRNLSDSLTFTEHLFGVYVDAHLTESLVLSDTFVETHSNYRTFSESIVFSELESVNRIFERSVTDTLVFPDYVVKFIGGMELSIPSAIATVLRHTNNTDDCETPNSGTCKLIGFSRQIVLPAPEFDDTIENANIMNVFRSETGRKVVSIKTQQLKTIDYDFTITRPKSLEYRAFILSEIDNRITLKNHKGEIWVGQIETNPSVLTAVTRWGPCTEGVKINLQLKAVRIH